MRFEERIEVKAPAEDVWGLLWDIERLARCLPGCEAINELEPRRKYAAVVVERIGPFQARFGLELSVTKVDPGAVCPVGSDGQGQEARRLHARGYGSPP